MSELKAGRELDALIAEKVMEVVACTEWTLFHHGGISGPTFVMDGSCPVHGGHPGEASQCAPAATFPPNYSTRIASAMEVLEKVYAKWGGKIRATIVRGSDGWYCKFVALTGHGLVGSAHADTAPLAICLAALAAVGGE